MLPDYRDIRNRIHEDPSWFDGNGVPRYDAFDPDMLGIYDKYALLVEIACQDCGERMFVGEGWVGFTLREGGGAYTLEDVARQYHYGDPPRHHCPGAGETMNCIDVRIVEAWEQHRDMSTLRIDWRRRPDIEEYDIMQEWAKS